MIAHLTVEFGAQRWGGIATAVQLAAEATARLGIETTVISPADRDRRTRTPEGYTVRTVEHDGPAGVYEAADRPAAGQALSSRLVEALQDERAGSSVTVMVHNEELAQALLILRSVDWCTERLAFSHGLARQEHPGRADLAEQQRTFLSAADRAFVASQSQRDLARAAYPDAAVFLLPLPLALLQERLAAWRQPVIKRRPAVLVAAGRAVPQKGFDLLLRALDVLDGHVESHLRLYLGHGSPGVVAQCAELAESLPNVTLEKWATQDALLRDIATAAAVVVPSRFEPLGLIAAEALALRTRVIGSDVGGLGDLLRDVPGCATVKTTDLEGPAPVALAEAIARVLGHDPLPADAKARLESFSVDRFGHALLQGCKR